MKITADTNVLVRAITGDDAVQSALAKRELVNADVVAVTLPTLCELVWVLAGGYKIPSPDIIGEIERLVGASNVAVNRLAVAAGLRLLAAGGDFADGVIAYEGRWLGAASFVSCDKKAVKLLAAQGQEARLLA